MGKADFYTWNSTCCVRSGYAGLVKKKFNSLLLFSGGIWTSSIAFTFCQTSKDKNVNFRINNIKFLEVLENNLKSLRKLKIKGKLPKKN